MGLDGSGSMTIKDGSHLSRWDLLKNCCVKLIENANP
jgi:hypothetical protein